MEVVAEQSGNCQLAGRELPPAAVLAADENLTARARQLRAAGVPGGMDELRALAYLEALGGLDPLEYAAAGSPAAAPGAGPSGTGRDGRAGPRAVPAAAGTAALAGAARTGPGPAAPAPAAGGPGRSRRGSRRG